MALGSGLAAQFGFATETTYGTAVTVTKFAPLVDESLTEDIERIESKGIIAGKRVMHSDQWEAGVSKVGGDIGLELVQQGIGTLFRHMFGSVTSSTTGAVSTHTFSPGDLTGLGFTAQVGKPQVGGVVSPFTYAGCKVASWEIGVVPNENVTLGLSVVAKTVTTGTALATATYITHGARPFRPTSGLTLSISGSGASVRELTLSGNNGLDPERIHIGNSSIDEPLETELREYEGSATIEFSTTAQYQRFAQGGEYPISFSLVASSTATITVTMNARFDGNTPTVDGPGLVLVEYPFKCVATSLTDDSTAISATLINSQTAGQI